MKLAFSLQPDRLPGPRSVFVIFLLVFAYELCFGFGYAVLRYSEIDHGGISDLHARGKAYVAPLSSSGLHYAESDYWDSSAYNYMAYSLIEKRGFFNPAGFASAWYTPGYPIILAILYGICGYWLVPVVCFNALCLALSFYFLFRLAREWLGMPAAWITLALSLVNLRASRTVPFVTTEPLFFFLVSAVAYLAYLLLTGRTRSWGVVLLLGAAAGYAVLVRPVMLPAIVPLAIVLMARRLAPGKICVFLAVVVLCFGGWLLRNQLVLGRPIISTNSDYYLVKEDRDAYRGLSFFDNYRVINKRGSRMTEFQEEARVLGEDDFQYMERSSWLFRRRFAEWCSQNFCFYIWLCAWRLKAILLPFTADMRFYNQLIATVLWLAAFLPGLLAAAVLYRKKYYWLLVSVAMGLLAMPVFFSVDPHLRYQMPTQLLLSVPAAYFWYHCIMWLRQPKKDGFLEFQPPVRPNA